MVWLGVLCGEDSQGPSGLGGLEARHGCFQAMVGALATEWQKKSNVRLQLVYRSAHLRRGLGKHWSVKHARNAHCVCFQHGQRVRAYQLQRWRAFGQMDLLCPEHNPPRDCAGTYPWTMRFFTICYMMKMYAVQRGWTDTAGWQLVSWTIGRLTGGPAPKQPRHSITSVLRPGRLDRYALQPVSEWVSWPQQHSVQ